MQAGGKCLFLQPANRNRTFMQPNIRPFFSAIPNKMEISEKDYAQAEACIAMADALSRSTNHSIYLIDYNRRNFLYVASNPLFLCGYTPEMVREKGYAFYLETVPPEEIRTLQEINEAGFRFHYSQPMEKRLDFTIEHDFHIRTSDRHVHLIHHKLSPVLLSPAGDIWLALCIVSLSPTKTPGNVLITDKTNADRFIYSFASHHWKKQPEILLTDRERDILQLSVKGLSNMEISEELFIDPNTVKFHKKKLFEKLHAKNITEAVGIAANLRLI